MEEYSIKCSGHTYITLFWGDKFIHCYDNDCEYMEDIINAIEKRTRKMFKELKILGSKEDFNGLRFRVGGFRKNWI